MLSTIHSATVHGLDGSEVIVEVDLQRGLRAFQIVGMPSPAVRESRERVAAALKNAGFRFPERRVTVNLAPADKPKDGAAFDLAMALGILCASKQAEVRGTPKKCVLGELSLDGGLRPTRGVLPITLCLRRTGVTELIVPSANAAEARLVPGIKVFGCRNLAEAVDALRGLEADTGDEPLATSSLEPNWAHRNRLRLSQIVGQEPAKRALSVAAAGGHHLLMEGPPGIGKSMLARCLPELLPPMSQEEILDVRRVLSVCGEHERASAGHVVRPFRAPHHTLTVPALVGGGRPVVPGEITRAQHGVLFLDELPEFNRGLLDLLRQPLEEGSIQLSRANATITFPARFQLVAAMNPCPCGMRTHPRKPCRCTPGEVQRYQNRISGPILDRLDLRVHLDVPTLPKASSQEHSELHDNDRLIREKIAGARKRQALRYEDLGNVHCNAQVGGELRKGKIRVRGEAIDFLRRAMEKWSLSMRAYERTIVVARTIADLDGVSDVDVQQIAEALQYRTVREPVS